MSEKKTVAPEAVPPAGEVSPEEQKLREASTITSVVENLKAREREKFMSQIVDELRGLEDIDDTVIPEFVDRRGSPVARVSSPTEPIYQRMSPEMQEWRSPEADHWYREWIVGQFQRDRARMMEASAKLDGMFGRADLLEGTAGASGAFSTGSGGEIIPRPLEAVVMIARDRVAKMRRFATIYQMTRQQHTIPTAGAMTASMVAEGTTSAESNPDIASVPLVAMKGQVRADASIELLDDAAVNLVNVFAMRGGGALGVLEDNQAFRLGSGTAPNITKISGATFTPSGTATTMAYADMLGMYYTPTQEYRDAAIWFIASNVLQMLSNVRDGTNGRPIYQGLADTPGPITDDPTAVGSIFRRPVYEVPFSDGEVWFGDPREYAFGSRQGITVSVSEHVRFAEDIIVWKITQRFAGNNTDTAAATVATGITAADNT